MKRGEARGKARRGEERRGEARRGEWRRGGRRWRRGERQTAMIMAAAVADDRGGIEDESELG